MTYAMIENAECSCCGEEYKLLSEFGMCADCVKGLTYDQYRRVTGDPKFPAPPPQPAPIIERHEITKTVVEPSPTLRAMLIGSLLMSLAGGGCVAFAMLRLLGK